MSHEKKNNRTLVLDSIVTLIFCQLETYERFKLRSLQDYILLPVECRLLPVECRTGIQLNIQVI